MRHHIRSLVSAIHARIHRHSEHIEHIRVACELVGCALVAVDLHWAIAMLSIAWAGIDLLALIGGFPWDA